MAQLFLTWPVEKEPILCSCLMLWATLAVIEFKKIQGPPGPPIAIRLSEDEVEKMVTGYGFKKIKSVDLGEYNYLMTFRSI